MRHARANRIDQLGDRAGRLAQRQGAAETLAALSSAAFAQTKQQLRQPVADAMEQHGGRVAAASEDIWTAPETLAHIRDYVARTFKKR